MSTAFTLDFEENICSAATALLDVKAKGGALFILTGAGMSVQSGVPVFRSSDGSMSADFLKFLDDFNKARRAAGMPEADDWFSFSVPEMFEKATEKEAWAYWRWRILRADVEPGADYKQLMRLATFFGEGNYFITTSNCDQLHVKAGAPAASLHEIHGTVGKVQCANHCTDELWPVDQGFKTRLEQDETWVPRCPHCDYALRPNVMIFGDNKLVSTGIDEQEANEDAFKAKHASDARRVAGGAAAAAAGSGGGAGSVPKASQNWAVLEIGAGVVVPSIRMMGHQAGNRSNCFIRVNPSESECLNVGKEASWDGTERGDYKEGKAPRLSAANYFPLVSRSEAALTALSDALQLPA